MNMNKGLMQKRKEKRPSLLEEIKVLKETIKSLQDENTNLSQNHHKLDKENAVMQEKLSSFGWRDLCKNAGWLGIGSAITAGLNRQYEVSTIIAIISCLLLLVFTVYDSFKKAKDKGKDKV